MDPRRKRSLGERGSGGIEGLAFGVLIFVFGTLVIVNAWGVIDAKLAVNSAAREAARAYVESDSQAGAESAASRSANSAMSGYNRVLADLSIQSTSFNRCAEIEVRAVTKVPRVNLPLIGAGGGHYQVVSVHSEVIDPYRSGLAGTAQCSAN